MGEAEGSSAGFGDFWMEDVDLQLDLLEKVKGIWLTNICFKEPLNL